jgi:hypothetical protein
LFRQNFFCSFNTKNSHYSNELIIDDYEPIHSTLNENLLVILLTKNKPKNSTFFPPLAQKKKKVGLFIAFFHCLQDFFFSFIVFVLKLIFS